MPLHGSPGQLWVGVILVVMLSAVGALPSPSSNCQTKCGEVDIPYPFGIGSDDSPDHCSLPRFNLSCKENGHGALRPFHNDVEVLGISLHEAVARMMMVMSSYCYNTTSMEMESKAWQVNLTGTPYRFSNTGNLFTVVGCTTLAYIADEDNKGKYMSGCVSMCRRGDVSTLTNGSCSGIGCCQTAIPKNLQYYQVWFDRGSDTSEIYNISRCSYAAPPRRPSCCSRGSAAAALCRQRGAAAPPSCCSRCSAHDAASISDAVEPLLPATAPHSAPPCGRPAPPTPDPSPLPASLPILLLRPDVAARRVAAAADAASVSDVVNPLLCAAAAPHPAPPCGCPAPPTSASSFACAAPHPAPRA